MYKYFTIDDFVKFYIHNTNNTKLIVTNNKLENNCNIYVYEIKKQDKLYYLYYIVYSYDYNKNNILISYYINNIEKNLNNDFDYVDNKSYELVDKFTTLDRALEYLNNQFNRIHKSHYLIHNSNIYRNSTSYYIHNISQLLKIS